MLLFLVCIVTFSIVVTAFHPGTLLYVLLGCAFAFVPSVPNLVRIGRIFADHYRQLPCPIEIKSFWAYVRALKGISGIAEAYINGEWECERIDEVVEYIYTHRLDRFPKRFPLSLVLIRGGIRRLKTWFTKTVFGRAIARYLGRTWEQLLAQKQYNSGNRFFSFLLGPTWAYTCAVWFKAETLDEAQIDKLEDACNRAGLKGYDLVLDIGCGNASFLSYAAEHYGIIGVGITTSEEQAKCARERCVGLPVIILVMEYQELLEMNWQFDVITSIGMFEAVLLEDYSMYAQVIHKMLKPGGRYYHHSIVRVWSGNGPEDVDPNPWIDKEVFPGNYLPRQYELLQLSTAMGAWPYAGLRPVTERFLDGTHYDRTLMAWYQNLETHWEEIRQNSSYDEKFYRKWKLWLTACAGSFRAGQYGVMQVTFEKVPLPEQPVPGK